jgi:transposase
MRKRTSYRKVKMSDFKKIYKNYIDGYSLREISSQMSIPKSTVSDYISRISSLGLSYEEISQINESDLYNLLFSNEKKEIHHDKLPDFKQIHNELGNKYVTLALLHEEYSTNNPEAYCYSHFCKLYEDWKKSKRISMRQSHIPGE